MYEWFIAKRNFGVKLSKFPPMVLFQGTDFSAGNAGVQDPMTEPCGRVAHGLLATIRFAIEHACPISVVGCSSCLFRVQVMYG